MEDEVAVEAAEEEDTAAVRAGAPGAGWMEEEGGAG